jgi:hypothetical protein
MQTIINQELTAGPLGTVNVVNFFKARLEQDLDLILEGASLPNGSRILFEQEFRDVLYQAS